jgi:hypothetical protein
MSYIKIGHANFGVCCAGDIERFGGRLRCHSPRVMSDRSPAVGQIADTATQHLLPQPIAFLFDKRRMRFVLCN